MRLCVSLRRHPFDAAARVCGRLSCCSAPSSCGRAKHHAARLPFVVEWLMTSGRDRWLILLQLAVSHALVMVPQAGFGPMLLQVVATIRRLSRGCGASHCLPSACARPPRARLTHTGTTAMRRSPRDNQESHRRIGRRAHAAGLASGDFRRHCWPSACAIFRSIRPTSSAFWPKRTRSRCACLPPCPGPDPGSVRYGHCRQRTELPDHGHSGRCRRYGGCAGPACPAHPAVPMRTGAKRIVKEATRTPTPSGHRRRPAELGEFSRVAVNAPALPGVTTRSACRASIRNGADFAHVLGYVGPVSDYDLSKIEDPDPLLKIPRFQIGKIGVEAQAGGRSARQGRVAADRGEFERPGHARAWAGRRATPAPMSA